MTRAGTVLVIEDEQNMRRVIRGLLQREGYEVREASDDFNDPTHPPRRCIGLVTGDQVADVSQVPLRPPCPLDRQAPPAPGHSSGAPYRVRLSATMLW